MATRHRPPSTPPRIAPMLDEPAGGRAEVVEGRVGGGVGVVVGEVDGAVVVEVEGGDVVVGGRVVGGLPSPEMIVKGIYYNR